jgi:outer membrane protein TolC/cell division septation protein DedD
MSAVLLAVLGIAGCAVTPRAISPETVLTEAKEDLAVLTQVPEPIVGPVDFYMAVARAVKYNREHRLKVMEAALSAHQLEVARFDMLPELTVSAGYKKRDSYAASASTTFENEVPAPLDANPAFTVSQGKRRVNEDVSFTWNVLDFGLSYVRAGQQADRYLITKERERKVLHNIIREVRNAYWRAVSADRLLGQLTPLMKRVNEALADSGLIERMRLESPMDALSYQRELLDIVRILHTQQRLLINAPLELAQLMGLTPGQDFTLAGSEWVIPEVGMDVAAMEETALVNRPELMGNRYESRISRLEVRAALLEMLPGLSFNTGLHFDNNDFLLNKKWIDYGTQVSWNLFSVFQGLAGRDVAKAMLSVAEEQRLSTSMAVLSQVHLANVSYGQARKEYEIAERYLDIAQRIGQHARIAQQAARAGELAVIREDVSILLAELRRSIAYAELQNSYGTIFSSMGLDPLPDALENHDVDTLAVAVAERFTRWSEVESGVVKRPIAEQGPVFDGPGDHTFTFSEETFTVVGEVLYSAKRGDGTPLPVWLTLDSERRTFAGNPPPGVDQVDIFLTAKSSTAQAADRFSLVIRNANDSPIARKLEMQKAIADTLFRYVIPGAVFGDADRGILSYQANLMDGTALPKWLVFDPQGHILNGTPGPEHVGAYSVAVTAVDVHGEETHTSIPIQVLKGTRFSVAVDKRSIQEADRETADIMAAVASEGSKGQIDEPRPESADDRWMSGSDKEIAQGVPVPTIPLRNHAVTLRYVGYLQIGAYEKRSNAERLTDSVRGALGVRTHIREVMRYSHPLYRVQVGPLVRTEVADVISALEGHGIMRHFLITK